MSKNKRPTFEEFMEIQMQDPEFKISYEALKPEFDLMRDFILARKKARCSQLELAERLDLQQPAIARLEGGGYVNTSVKKLVQVADALGYSMKISLSPKKLDVHKSKASKLKPKKIKV